MKNWPITKIESNNLENGKKTFHFHRDVKVPFKMQKCKLRRQLRFNDLFGPFIFIIINLKKRPATTESVL